MSGRPAHCGESPLSGDAFWRNSYVEAVGRAVLVSFMADRHSHSDPGRVLRFRHRRSDELLKADDLAQYAQTEEPDDYRHRMLVNVAGLVVVALLVGIGWWIADTMATMRKNQDCVLAGHRGCTPVEIDRERR